MKYLILPLYDSEQSSEFPPTNFGTFILEDGKLVCIDQWSYSKEEARRDAPGMIAEYQRKQDQKRYDL